MIAALLAAATPTPSPSPSSEPMVDPSLGSPGILGFVFTFVLALVLVGLVLSMTRHLRRVDRNARLAAVATDGTASGEGALPAGHVASRAGGTTAPEADEGPRPPTRQDAEPGTSATSRSETDEGTAADAGDVPGPGGPSAPDSSAPGGEGSA